MQTPASPSLLGDDDEAEIHADGAGRRTGVNCCNLKGCLVGLRRRRSGRHNCWIWRRRRRQQSLLTSSSRLESHVSVSKTSRDVKMERQQLRHHHLNCRSLDSGDPISVREEEEEESTVITPPKDFQDHLADSCKITSSSISESLSVVVSGGVETILEPPAMFRPATSLLRPRTELFWTRDHPAWPLSLLPAVNETTSQVFNDELERLKSHSLFLRFPLDGAARVHYRSSKSVVIQSTSVNQYR